jgi:hypothetical protein
MKRPIILLRYFIIALALIILGLVRDKTADQSTSH